MRIRKFDDKPEHSRECILAAIQLSWIDGNN
ncbi:Fe-S cluster assembly protein IscX [uncultured Psychromonas sp.]